MRITIFCFTAGGVRACERVLNALPQHSITAFAPPSCAGGCALPRQEALQQSVKKAFVQGEALLFVGAAGIAVRAVAPLLQSKLKDPAVLCMDELCHNVIPLLGGHVGGANRLARELAHALGANPIITTASDVLGVFAVDEWAEEQGLFCWNTKAARAVACALLQGQEVGLSTAFPCVQTLPQGLCYRQDTAIGICIDWEEAKPFPTTLNLVPKVVVVGMGCKKGIAPKAAQRVAENVLAQLGISPKAVCVIASIDLKKEEEALLHLAEAWEVPFLTYTAEQLRTVEGTFSASAFVQQVTGVDCVCERATLLASGAQKLLLSKTAVDGVTIALSQIDSKWIFVGSHSRPLEGSAASIFH